jgi:hypothetical protein
MTGKTGDQMRSFTVLGIVPFVFFASLLAAQSLRSHLIVTVEDASGAPIPDAGVQVQHWVGGSGHKPHLVQDGLQTTDAQGRATFEVPEYQYEILASAQAFAPAVTSVEVYGGHEFSRVLKLSVRTGGGVKVQAIPKSQ